MKNPARALIPALQKFKALGPALRLSTVAGSLAVASAAAQAPLDIRVALIIGNSAYVGAPVLGNPANDARAMSEVLRSLGFSVIELRDGSRDQMAAAIAKVSVSLKDKQGVGMLYYAGHGLQLDWHNYMVPVDARLKKASDVPLQAIDLSSVIDAFKGAGNRMNIVVLDACRDNPFASNTSSAKGLAQLDAPPGTFLAYATAPGNVAEDGDETSGNGLYTQFLLQELKKPTAKIEDVFKRVRLNVRKQSQGRQIPWESTSLEDDFFFNDGVKFTFKPEELARMAAEVKAREQQRVAQAAAQEAQAQERGRQLALQVAQEQARQQAQAQALEQQRLAQVAAQEAQARERERQLALQVAQEQVRQQAQAQALEQQRLAAIAQAKEAERLGAQARAKVQEKLAAEALAREQQRLAQEAQARERQQALVLEQTKERERQQAQAQVREQQRLAAVAQALELERLAALAKVPVPEKKLSREELREIAFKEEKAAWDLIKTSSRADDFYTFLQRYPSAGELSEMAQYRLDQLAKPKIVAALGQGQDASLGYTGERFKMGDEYQIQFSDILTNVAGNRQTMRVTAIDGNVIEFNGGAGVVTALGATIENARGNYDPPFGGRPVELQVGKSWSGRSNQLATDGKTYELSFSAKIVAREPITVPAGTFQTYVIESVTYISNGGPTVRVKMWVDPRFGYPIKREEIARNKWGNIIRSDRQELLALKAERS